MRLIVFILILLTSPAYADATLTPSNLTSGASSTDATSYATASISPTAHAIVFVTAYSRQAVGTTTPTVTGDNLTCATEDSVLQGTNRQTTFIRCRSSATTTGTLTIDFAGNTQTSAAWIVDQFTGSDSTGSAGSGAIVQNPTATTGTSTSTSITLADLSKSSNIYYSVISHDSTDNVTAGGTSTELAETETAENSQTLQSQYGTDTTQTTSWLTNSRAWEAMAFEIKSAGTNLEGSTINASTIN